MSASLHGTQHRQDTRSDCRTKRKVCTHGRLGIRKKKNATQCFISCRHLACLPGKRSTFDTMSYALKIKADGVSKLGIATKTES